MTHLFEIAATLLAGLGLFFAGLKEVSRQLTTIGHSRLREMVTQASANPALGVLWGILTGFITQSGRTTSYLVASLVHTGVLPLGRALPLVLWANTGCSLMIVAAFLPTESLIYVVVGLAGLSLAFEFPPGSLIYVVVGLAGLSLAFEFPPGSRSVSGALFSLALILFGLQLVKTSSTQLLAIPWAATLLDLIRDSGPIAFVAGTLLTVISQSHIAIILLSIVMAQSGVLIASDHIFMQVYGAYAGSAVLTFMLGLSFKGVARQSVMAQVLYNLVGTALFVGLLYAEQHTGIPLVQAAAARVSPQLPAQAAFVAILFNVVTCLLLTILAR